MSDSFFVGFIQEVAPNCHCFQYTRFRLVSVGLKSGDESEKVFGPLLSSGSLPKVADRHSFSQIRIRINALNELL